MSTIMNISMSRRQFLGLGAAAGASVFLIGVSLPTGCARVEKTQQGEDLNAFVGIDADGQVIFQNPFIEMGQGTYTSIPAIMAEELDIDMSAITVVQAPHGPDYKIMFDNTMRFTGGSLSVRSSYETMRKVGATARTMLIQAAAEQWGVKPGECTTEPGSVVHASTGKKLSYGQLAAKAAKLDPPKDVQLKDSASFRLIGQPVKRTDSLVKSTGAAEFGIDVKVDGMLTAAVMQSPVFGGKVASYDKDAVLKMPGVVAVEEIPNGVAVIADHFWHAKKALEKLPVTFDEGENANFSTKDYLARLQSALSEAGHVAEEVGDAGKAMPKAAKKIEAEYHAPFIAHVTMEPMNCTALVTKDRCTVWAPNQGVDFVVGVAAEITGLKPEAIEVITPFLGGGFGRRFVMDYAIQAITLAKKHPGKPIKVIWTREEDLQHDHYRPMSAANFSAGFDKKGNPVALLVTSVGEGPMTRLMPAFVKNPDLDTSVFEGTVELPYAIPNKRTNVVNVPVKPVPIGFWRSVGHSQNCFFKESFIDEMAHAVRADPLEFRLKLLAEQPRFKKVLETAAQLAGWKARSWTDPKGSKRAMGVALHESFNSIVAEVAEVSLNQDGEFKVERVCCAVDCGFAVNPAIVKRQIESGVAYGLSAAMGEAITLEKGRVVQSNFDTYPILRPDQMPVVEVEIINSGAPLGGIGEPGTPPIAPAVCNALFLLSGQRVRSLPLSKYSF
ncbi:MAG: xanthine dehydrogenase family protein molybdopterin-binding subunit [Methylococcaceae bacterium]|nr:xanthine dehydrogenase family protein molybdopterin-binding subunit [Methylococcaceae bacterium]